MKFIRQTVLVFLCLLIAYNAASAQNKQVRDALRKIAVGKSEEAKAILSDLQEKYPADPGIIYLQASLTPEADKAIALYRKILNEYNKSEWADDSYWRLVQYYAIKGDTLSALKALDQFKTYQPTSEFLAVATDVVNTALIYNRSSKCDAESKKTTDIKEQSVNKPAPTPEKDNAEIKPKDNALVPAKNQDKDEKFKKWGWQVGVYSTVQSAKEVCDKFQKNRLKNQIVEKEVDGKKMFAVIIGKYSNKEDAEKARTTIQKICNCETVLYGFK